MRLRQRGLERDRALIVLDRLIEITTPEQNIGQVEVADRFMLADAQCSSVCSFGANGITQALEREAQVNPS